MIGEASSSLADSRPRARERQREHEGSFGVRTIGDLRELVGANPRPDFGARHAPEASTAPIQLTGDALDAVRLKGSLAPAIELILTALRGPVARTRHLVAIGDANANLLWVVGESRTGEAADEIRVHDGTSCADPTAGPSAARAADPPGLALEMFSGEHLIAAVDPSTCSDAPVHDPAGGELIGVVLTAELRTSDPPTAALAALAACAAESTIRADELGLRVDELERAARLRDRWESEIAGRRSGSVLVDARGLVIASRGAGQLPASVDLPLDSGRLVQIPDGRTFETQCLGGDGAILWLRRRRGSVVPKLHLHLLGAGADARLGKARPERGLRSLELLAVLAMHREGLTAEQLALALYGERGKAVTIRVQVHRVRDHLGEGALQTQPYRLADSFDADSLEVERLVAAGHPGEALRAYLGPLLPASDAPAIVEARGVLDESLRRSILTTADPDLLSRWLIHPSGTDDLAAARTLVAALPVGDPRRAAASASAAAVGRRMSLVAPVRGRPGRKSSTRSANLREGNAGCATEVQPLPE